MHAPQQSLTDWFSTNDSPLIQHLRRCITTQERSIDGLEELLIRELIYEGKPDGDWKTAAQSHIGVCELTYTDHTTLRQYWHFQRQEPLTSEQVAAELDLRRLIPSDLLFFEAGKSR